MNAPLVKLTQDGPATALVKPAGYLGGDLFNTYRRAIEGARFDGTRRVNLAPVDKVPGMVKRLREAGFAVEIDASLAESLKKHTAQVWLDVQGAKDRVEALDRALHERGEAMRPYQKTGVEWLISRHGAVLADEQGLGKSLSALMTVPAEAPVLVICPASLKGNWMKEARRWRPTLAVATLEGRGSFRWPEPGELVAVNFDILPDGHEKDCKDRACQGCSDLPEPPPGVILIVDEAHKVKNPKAQRTRNMRVIGTKVRARGGRTYVLTGTPLQNRPEELWNVFQAADVALEAFGSWKGFVECFGGYKETIYVAGGGRRQIMKWGTPTPEAADRIRRVFLRRTKADVAKDLPSKSRKYVPVTVDKKTIAKCDALLKEIGGEAALVRLLGEGKRLQFESMSETRAALASAKIHAMVEEVEAYEDAEEPLLVFSWHRAPIDLLEGREGWAVITGDTPAKERDRIVDDFQAGKLKGLGATIQAAGVGLTLTRSSNVLFVDRSWNPADNEQAEDRVHRIGQHHPVTITILVADHVLDSRVQTVLDGKRALIDASVEQARDIPGQQEGLREASETEKRLWEESMAVDLAIAQGKEAPVVEGGRRSAKPKRREASGPREEWAASALTILSNNDPDRAQTVNGVGFNKLDGSLGHSLASQLGEGLTDKQWALAVRVCQKYHAQVGDCP